jgi:transcriptional regulator with XRE-family HTH domain
MNAMCTNVQSLALDALAHVLDERDPYWTQTELAHALGVTQAAVSRWFAGHCRPKASTILRIESLFGVPMRAWFEPMPESARAFQSRVAS